MGTTQRSDLEVIGGLGTEPLERLRERFPVLWEEVSAAIVEALAKGNPQAPVELMQKARGEADSWAARLVASQQNPKVAEAALPHLVRSRLVFLGLEKCLHAAAAAQTGGRVRFGLIEGTIVQRLLFQKGLERKPASLTAFRRFWPLVRQKRILMPLVQARGIYCFYTRELVAELKALVAGRTCVEIAAGDGTLSRFLRDAGVEVAATDNRAWSKSIQYPDWVEDLDARGALQKHRPEVVLCSWPPPGNGFERHVLAAPYVQAYVVIGSRHTFASGDWEAYRKQQAFEWAEDEKLSALVLPPELDSAVLVFRRKQS